MNAKEYIATRAAEELDDGDIVNLGIGLPTLVANYIPKDKNIFLHSENGILGVGPSPKSENIDPDLVNAGKLPVTTLKGASFFDSAMSFAMIRGKHLDVAILGVLQVDQFGKIANWAIPGKNILGVGGAMDLLEGSKKVIVTMLHTTKNGDPKIVKELSYPITSKRQVDVIITDLAVFRIDEKGLMLTEIAPGKTLEEVEAGTSAPFRIAKHLNFVKEGKMI